MLNDINDLIKESMKSGDKFKLSVLRMLKGAIQNEAINLKKELTDDECKAVVKKQVKMRKESLAEFEKFNKTDDAENVRKEIEILSVYMPLELTVEQITVEVDKMFEEIKPEGIKDFGKCMKYATQNIKDADMQVVSSMIKTRLT